MRVLIAGGGVAGLEAMPPEDAGVDVEVDLTTHPPGAPGSRRGAVLAGGDGREGHLDLLAYDR